MNNPVPSRPELLDLYKIHVEEVRFQTKFNWERTQYLLVLNLGLVGVAAGIWKADQNVIGLYLIASLFLAGTTMCLMSIAAIRQGHSYYRRTILQKARIEHLLGLIDVASPVFNVPSFDLTTSSTPGKEDALALLAHPEKYLTRRQFRRGQINWYIQAFLYGLAAIDLIGLIVAIYQLAPQLIWR